LLGEIHPDLRYAVKGVDIYNELQATNLPREYGGVGILWHQDIDQEMNIIEGGNERIQAVELLQDNNSPIPIASVYMPTGGGNKKNH
jgi:exonuclease III